MNKAKCIDCFHFDNMDDFCSKIEIFKFEDDDSCREFESMKGLEDMYVNNQKIVCLVGASGSGKTTIAKELEKEGYNIIESYTTREPREEGEWGHAFTDFPPMKSIDSINGMTVKGLEIDKSKMIAYFNDYDKNKHYWATVEQYKNKGTSIYVVDPDGAEQVQKNVKDAEVVTIFLMVDEEVRFTRINGRLFSNDRKELSADSIMLQAEYFEEIEYRIKKDKEIFKTCKCDYVVDANGELEEVVGLVSEIVERNESCDK